MILKFANTKKPFIKRSIYSFLKIFVLIFLGGGTLVAAASAVFFGAVSPGYTSVIVVSSTLDSIPSANTPPLAIITPIPSSASGTTATYELSLPNENQLIIAFGNLVTIVDGASKIAVSITKTSSDGDADVVAYYQIIRQLSATGFFTYKILDGNTVTNFFDLAAATASETAHIITASSEITALTVGEDEITPPGSDFALPNAASFKTALASALLGVQVDENVQLIAIPSILNIAAVTLLGDVIVTQFAIAEIANWISNQKLTKFYTDHLQLVSFYLTNPNGDDQLELYLVQSLSGAIEPENALASDYGYQIFDSAAFDVDKLSLVSAPEIQSQLISKFATFENDDHDSITMTSAQANILWEKITSEFVSNSIGLSFYNSTKLLVLFGIAALLLATALSLIGYVIIFNKIEFVTSYSSSKNKIFE